MNRILLSCIYCLSIASVGFSQSRGEYMEVTATRTAAQDASPGYDLVNVSGSGVLYHASASNTCGASTNGFITVIVDGVTYQSTGLNGAGTEYMPTDSWSAWSSTLTEQSFVEFKNSLIIRIDQINCGSITGNASYGVD